MKIVIFVQKKIKPNTKQKMKDFLKYMLAAIVGVCIVGVVFTIIGIMSIAGRVERHPQLDKKSKRERKDKGHLPERGRFRLLSGFIGRDTERFGGF